MKSPSIRSRVKESFDKAWGNRFFARAVKTPQDYLTVMDYIDKNPVKSGLTLCVGDHEASGAYHIRENITGFVDYYDFIRQFYTIRQLRLPPPKKVHGTG
ncbi:hypothetical protein FACS189494_07810 [Spirochaetia bacterium]|nr:hypothetical protein FACS189494_07810 [Spirochaetia bacterium]